MKLLIFISFTASDILKEVLNNIPCNGDFEGHSNNESNEHKCEFCDKVYKSINHLQKHINTLHSSEMNLESCEYCLKMIRSKKIDKHVDLCMKFHKYVLEDSACGFCGKDYDNVKNSFPTRAYEFILSHMEKNHDEEIEAPKGKTK